jgi:iron complex transport system ATP-binding protein
VTPIKTDDVVLHADKVVVDRSGRRLLDDVDLTVRRSQHWALLGPNGAGKTTLINILGAVNHPTSGTAEVLGNRLGRVDMRALRQLIGHVNPRHPLDFPLKVTEIVLTGITGTIDVVPRWQPTDQDLTLAGELIASVGMTHVAESRWDTLSQGERGRALVARALIARPPLLLLDEPATGLDVAAREQLLQTIDHLRRRYTSLSSVMVTHHLEDLPGSTTHAMLLRDGRVLAAGEVHQVITSDLVSKCFDFPIDVQRSGGRWTARSRDTAATTDEYWAP